MITSLLICLSSLFFTPSPSGRWHIEAESPETRVEVRGDTLDIITPQGLSLWWDEALTAPCTIDYRACVVDAGGPYDRVSDLNCFWMATEDNGESPLRSAPHRHGIFAESYRLRCYYLGYGGNHNTTTRFRRYDGDSLAVHNTAHRPAIITEFTDSAHLLRPNHWYAIHIEVHEDASTIVTVDDTTVVAFTDPHPIRHGWFAFRTTWSHILLTGFRVKQS